MKSYMTRKLANESFFLRDTLICIILSVGTINSSLRLVNVLSVIVKEQGWVHNARINI
jgi:hypothetical protein